MDVDFTNRESAVEHLNAVTRERRCAIRARALLRVWAHFDTDQGIDPYLRGMSRLLRATVLLTAEATGRSKASHLFLHSMNSIAGWAAENSGYHEAYTSSRYALRALEGSYSDDNGHDPTNAEATYITIEYSAGSVQGRTASDYRQPPNPMALAATQMDFEDEEIAMLCSPLWRGVEIPRRTQSKHQLFLDRLHSEEKWTFWRRWYQAMWDGTFADWDLLSEVARIEDVVWDAGLEAVAARIGEIEAKTNLKEQSIGRSDIQGIQTRIANQKDGIALSAVSLIAQLDTFREDLRGSNSLDPEVRDSLFDFIDRLSDKLTDLLSLLPTDNTKISKKNAIALAQWMREFRRIMRSDALSYVTPGNVSKSIVPLSIILGSGAVGAFVAGPAGLGVGSFVGGLITNQVKPSKVASDLVRELRSDDP